MLEDIKKDAVTRMTKCVQTFQASTILGNQTYGVGIPIMIDFNTAVAPKFRATVERAIEIGCEKEPVRILVEIDAGQQIIVTVVPGRAKKPQFVLKNRAAKRRGRTHAARRRDVV